MGINIPQQHRTSRQVGEVLFTWSPMVWTFVFVLLAMLYAPTVPLNYAWDNFLYLTAVHDGGTQVYLGWGRSAFIFLGYLARDLGILVLWADLFTTWKMWMISGLVLHAFTLVPLTVLLIRWIGPMATHVAMGIFVLYPQQMVTLFGVWAENQALTAFLLAALVLGTRTIPIKPRLIISAVLGVTMVLIKEVNVFYIPFLALLAFWQLPPTDSLRRRLGIAAAHGAAILIVSLLVYFIVYPLFMPELQGARKYLEQRYFGMETVGYGAGTLIITAIYAILMDSGIVLLLCLLILPWLLVHLTGWRLRAIRSQLPLLTLGLTLTLVPFLILVTSGQVEMMTRQAIVLVPGLALLAAVPWARPLPRSLAGSLTKRVTITAILAVLMLGFSNWKIIREFSYHSQQDARRYEHMKTLFDEETGVWVGVDSWPAHYMLRFSDAPPHRDIWDIHWPGWDQRENLEEALQWRDGQVEANRRVVLSKNVVDRLATTPEELFALFPGYTFEEHPSEWWVGTPPRETD